MNKILIIACLMAAGTIQAQSLSPTVIASAGDYSTGNGVSLSWTLGEMATETFSNGGYTLNQGFQQPVTGIAISGINLDLLVFIEGPFTGMEMVTSLNAAAQLPLSQPYNSAPWNYSGTEAVPLIPNTNIVDWVLVELRDASDAFSATSATRIARQAGFLLKDGSVTGLDGSSILQFTNTYTQQLFVVVWHRNHLGIMSANGITETGGIFAYDFSVSDSMVHGGSSGYKNITGGVWGMAAGDATQDGLINLSDETQWAAFAGQNGYMATDFNLNTQVNNPDKDDYWLPNRTLSSQVPE
jgi:hypothetical protein